MAIRYERLGESPRYRDILIADTEAELLLATPPTEVAEGHALDTGNVFNWTKALGKWYTGPLTVVDGVLQSDLGAQFGGAVSVVGDGLGGGRWLGTYQNLDAIIAATILGGPQLGDFVILREGGFASYCGTPPSWQPVVASTLAPI